MIVRYANHTELADGAVSAQCVTTLAAVFDKEMELEQILLAVQKIGALYKAKRNDGNPALLRTLLGTSRLFPSADPHSFAFDLFPCVAQLPLSCSLLDTHTHAHTHSLLSPSLSLSLSLSRAAHWRGCFEH